MSNCRVLSPSLFTALVLAGAACSDGGGGATTCGSDAACGAGRFCTGGACSSCSLTEPSRCGNASTPAGCRVCTGATPVCSAGACVCTSDSSCGAGKYCSSGACVACAANDPSHCGSAASPAGCQVCSGATPECSNGMCVAPTCASDAACGAGKYCSGGACLACSLSDATHCGTESSAAGCDVCSGTTPVCQNGACVAGGCTSDAACGAGKFCDAGACTACSATDAQHCGTSSSAAGCQLCSGATPVCQAGACVAAPCASDAACGDGKYCDGGTCTACSATDAQHCGTATTAAGCQLCSGATPVCSNGTCSAPACTTDASCGVGKFCNGGTCASCLASDANHCGTSSTPAGCRVCSGETPACASGACVCTADASCGAGKYCVGGACSNCSLSDAGHCGSASAPAGCRACTGSTPVCSLGNCVCTTDAQCGAGKYCVGGACESCSATDAAHCGTATSAAGCRVCSGATPVCSSGACVASGATCANDAACGAGKFCGTGGTCESCSASDANRCGTETTAAGCRVCSGATPVCSAGACIAAVTTCANDAACGAGKYCGAGGSCLACSTSNPARCGTAASAAGCQACSGATPVCTAGACTAAPTACTNDAGCANGKYCGPGGSCLACSDSDRFRCGTAATAAGCQRCDGICNAGACVACTSNTQCGADGPCTAGKCAGAGRPGAACTADGDCGGTGAICDTYVSGGYCLQPCTAGGTACPTGSFCLSFNATAAYCVEGQCQTDAECSRRGEGFVCDSDKSCWSYNYVPVNSGADAAGSPCADGDACESGICIPATSGTTSTGYAGGYCTSYCKPEVAGSCPPDAVCTNVAQFGTTLCMQACSGTCTRPGYSCVDGACVPTPTCGDGICNGGESSASCCDDCGCGAGQTCAAPAGGGAKSCTTTNPTGKNPGEACAADAECKGEGSICVKRPGGYCLMLGCTPGANGTSDCPSGSTCVSGGQDDQGNTIYVCAAGPCATDAECRQSEGYVCDTDHVCWSYQYVPVNTGGAAMGAACTDNAQCESGVCIAESWNVGYTGGYCSVGCVATTAGSCPTGSACVDQSAVFGVSICAKNCTQNSDCRTGYVCTAGACLPPAPSCGDGTCSASETQATCCEDCGCPAGQNCGTDHACHAGGGSVPAGGACTQDSQCTGTGAVCDTYLPGGYCLLPCATDNDCAAGSYCQAFDGGVSYCVEGRCAADSDCSRQAAGYTCLTDYGLCWSYAYTDVNPNGADAGAACTAGTGCKSDVCIPETYEGSPTGYPGGYCTAVCRSGVAASCPTGTVCVDESAQLGAWICEKACAANTDCRTGYACTGGVCTPAGTTPGGSPPGGACTADTDCAGTGATCYRHEIGGYCYTTGCAAGGSDCPAGSFCIPWSEDAQGNTVNACVEGQCTTDADCNRRNEGYICDTDGTCWSYLYAAVNTGGAAIGAACADDAACESDICVPETYQGSPTGYAGGYCLVGCKNGVAGNCPTGSKCVDQSAEFGAWVCEKTCTTNAECRTGYGCTAGACEPGSGTAPVCGDNACNGTETQATCCEDCGCPTGQNCGTDHACHAAGAGTTAPGGACTQDSDCAGTGAKCSKYLTGGYCLIPCTAGGTACPSGSFCLQFSSTSSYCVEGQCQNDSDCSRQNEGYICDVDHSCWSYAYVVVNPSGSAVGAACTDDAGCQSGLCLTDDYGYTGGYCTAQCVTTLASSCPTGSTCVDDPYLGPLCETSCTSTANCRSGYTCNTSGGCEPQ